MGIIQGPTPKIDPSADRRKLYIMIVALLGTLLLMFVLFLKGNAPKTDEDALATPEVREEITEPLTPTAQPPAKEPDGPVDTEITDSELITLLERAKSLTPEIAREQVNHEIKAKELLARAAEAKGELIYVEGVIARFHSLSLPGHWGATDNLWYV